MKKRLPNIILIVMDTVGAKHMSLYGYSRCTTPNLERIADEFTVYARCFSPSCWTLPAHASMFTGLYPSQHGAHEGNFYLEEQYNHVVNLLNQAGYKTYGFSSNYTVAPVTGIGRYFDFFRDYGNSEEWLPNGGERYPLRRKFFQRFFMEGTFTGKVNLLSRYVLTTRDWPILKTYVKRYLRKFNTPDPMACSTKYSLKSLQGGLEIIRKHSLFNDSSPYFLFINLMEAHHFYNPPSQVRKFSSPKDKQTFPTSSFYNVNRLKKCGNLIPNWINLYDDEIVYLDSLLGSFYDHLKQNNLLDNTVLIFTSDHGEHFGEKGHYEHRLSLYNELIWVPLLLKLPGSLAFPGVRDRLTSLNDLFSTILDLAESPWPHPFTSNSLLDNEAPGTTASMIIDSRPWQDRMTADFGHNQRWLQGLRSHRFALMLEEGWKLIEGEDGRLEVYNLSHAPLEDRDLLQDLPSDLQGNFQELFRLQKGKILSATS